MLAKSSKNQSTQVWWRSDKADETSADKADETGQRTGRRGCMNQLRMVFLVESSSSQTRLQFLWSREKHVKHDLGRFLTRIRPPYPCISEDHNPLRLSIPILGQPRRAPSPTGLLGRCLWTFHAKNGCQIYVADFLVGLTVFEHYRCMLGNVWPRAC